jgi:hypothetical protein
MIGADGDLQVITFSQFVKVTVQCSSVHLIQGHHSEQWIENLPVKDSPIFFSLPYYRPHSKSPLTLPYEKCPTFPKGDDLSKFLVEQKEGHRLCLLT